MNSLKTISALLILLICSCDHDQKRSTKALAEVIQSYQDNKGYDEKLYPLGLFTKAHYKAEADFAASKLEKLSKIEPDKSV